MIIDIVHGDLLDAEQRMICQQCNCVTMIPHGLSMAIAKKYPWANIYAQRPMLTRNCTSRPSVPGTIQISTSPFEKRIVIHLFGQYLPNKSVTYTAFYKKIPHVQDSYKDREVYFQQCLDELDKLELAEPVAMPYLIGCGLAGGNWAKYETMLRTCKTKLFLYKL